MKKFKTETITHQITTHDVTTCDRCKKDCEKDFPGYGDANDGDSNEFHLTWQTSSIWDGPNHNVDVDLCRDCRVWLFKLLQREGVNVQGLDGDL